MKCKTYIALSLVMKMPFALNEEDWKRITREIIIKQLKQLIVKKQTIKKGGDM